MNVQVRVPTPLRRLTGGEAVVSANGVTVGALVDDMESNHPGIKERLCDEEGQVRRFVNIFVNGEDIRFLCRRLVILASEDIGNADPQALVIAVAAMQACEMVGLPECQLTLAQAVTYLACSPKSNASTTAIGAARKDIREGRVLPVPTHLRDSHYGGAEQLGHGDGYIYAHNEQGGVASQDYLGVERLYYQPVDRGFEAELLQRLETIRARLKNTRQNPPERDGETKST